MINLDDIQSQFNHDTAGSFGVDIIKNKYLGRKHGLITKAFEALAALSIDDKKRLGPALNEVRNQIEAKLSLAQSQSVDNLEADLTLPPLQKQPGHLHPKTIVQKELEEAFKSLGFSVVYGPEIENDFY